MKQEITLVCVDCGRLYHRETRVCDCGSEEVGDAEMHHVLARLDVVERERLQAIKERNEAQMTAGAFQTEALLLRGELDAMKSKRRIA